MRPRLALALAALLTALGSAAATGSSLTASAAAPATTRTVTLSDRASGVAAPCPPERPPLVCGYALRNQQRSSPPTLPANGSTATPEPGTGSSATPTPTPTATPTPPPPTAGPTTPPTPYVEQVLPSPSSPSLPASHAGLRLTPEPNGSGSSLPQLVLLAMVVLGVVAGASIFLFFRIR